MKNKLLTWDYYKELLLRFKTPLIAGLIAGLLSYTYIFCNKLVQWDEIFYSFSKGASLEAGRWGLDILQFVFPNYSMPWLWGICSLSLIVLSACFIINIFDVKSKLYQCIIVALTVTFPSVISSFSYMFQSITYAFGVFISFIGLYILSKEGKLKKIFSILCFAFAFSIYQAFISIIASFWLLLLVKDLLKEETKPSKALINAVINLCYVIFALAIYLLITVVLFKIKGISFSAITNRTEGEESMGLLMRFLNTYLYFAGFFVNGTNGVMPNLLSVVCHFVALVTVVMCAIKFLKENKSNGIRVITVLVILVLPIAINAIIFISTGTHTLMIYGFISVYVLAVMMLEKVTVGKENITILPKISKVAMPLAMGLIILSNIFTANAVYLRMTYSNTALYSYYIEMSTRIKMCEGYQEGDRVAIVGKSDELRFDIDGEYGKYTITGTNALDVNIYSKKEFIKYYLGNDFDFLSFDEIEENIKPLSEFEKMPTYPYDGSVKKINGCIVIKISD